MYLENVAFTLKTTGNKAQKIVEQEPRQHWLDVRKIPAMTKKNSWHILGLGRAIITCDRRYVVIGGLFPGRIFGTRPGGGSCFSLVLYDIGDIGHIR